MTKEEIALQLALSRIDKLQKTMSTNSYSESAEYNKELGVQIASLYNTIYNNLSCLDNPSSSIEDVASQIKTY